jgi:hypothetical protein
LKRGRCGPRGEPSPGPGWYADPAGKPCWRWWDGSAWTNSVYFAPKKGKAKTVILVSTVVIVLALVTVFGLAGSTSDADWVACNSDASSIGIALEAYHANNNVWPPAGPVDRTSVLLKGPTPMLSAAPSNNRYSINTDGLGGVLVAIPPARSGGVQYYNGLPGDTPPGSKNPCDALK